MISSKVDRLKQNNRKKDGKGFGWMWKGRAFMVVLLDWSDKSQLTHGKDSESSDENVKAVFYHDFLIF